MIGEDDSCTIIHVKLLAWHSNFKNAKHIKKICEELMPIA